MPDSIDPSISHLRSIGAQIGIDAGHVTKVSFYHTGVTDEDLALEAIRDVGPSGHFLGADHTQERYKTAFYSPFLSDWRNFESWEQAGGIQTPERANRIFKAILAQFEAPPMDVATLDALKDFVERRKREGGAPTDF